MLYLKSPARESTLGFFYINRMPDFKHFSCHFDIRYLFESADKKLMCTQQDKQLLKVYYKDAGTNTHWRPFNSIVNDFEQVFADGVGISGPSANVNKNM